jgi:hypothetical protein
VLIKYTSTPTITTIKRITGMIVLSGKPDAPGIVGETVGSVVTGVGGAVLMQSA